MKSVARVAAVVALVAFVLGVVGCAKDGDDGAPGPAGAPAVNAGPVSGLAGTVAVSKPAGGGGAFFDAGEQITVTVTATAANAKPTNGEAPREASTDINSTNYGRARLYIYGPLAQSKTAAAQNLMRATSASGYVDLIKQPPQDGLTVSGSVVTFVTNPVGAEEPGTYRLVVWLQSKTETYERSFVIKEFQIKTATLETETVSKTQCAACHRGADNGQYYFAHTDPSSYSATGTYEIDNEPVANCKTCHNQAGYSNTTDAWVAARTRTPDPIIRRVHGIHMGEELKSPRNTHRMAVTGAVVTSSWAGLNPQDAAPFAGLGLIRGQTSGAQARINNSNGSATGATWFGLGHITGGEFSIGETVDVFKITDLTRTGYEAVKAANKIGTAVVAESLTYNSDGSTNSVAVQEGYFADYTTVVFPSDVRHCTKCHIDDNWKTKPSQYACGTCHDNIWWGATTATPEGFKNHPGAAIPDITNGVAGAEHNTALCSGCHTSADPGFAGSIEGSHEVPTFYQADQSTPATQPHTVALAMTPPANASYYVAGETPKVYVWVTDVATGLLVTPSTITEGTWVNGLSLFVSGPRAARSAPVLTSQAKSPVVSATCGNNEKWNLSGSPQFILTVNGKTYTLTALPASFVDSTQATATEVVAWLNANATLPAGGGAAFNTVIKAFKDSTGKKVTIRTQYGVGSTSMSISATSSAGFTGTAATNMKWTTGAVSFPSTYGNDLRVRVDPAWDNDPKVTRNDVDKRIEYQLDDVAGLTSGTYNIYVNGSITRPDAYALISFQVGTATADKYIAKNCADCHGDHLMHLDAGGRHPAEFNTDYCKSCHDYKLEGPSASTWAMYGNVTVSDAWAAYGADPIVKKVHGVHRGHYLQYPDKIYPNNPLWSGMIFPQDVRNCTKCHSSDTTGSWDTAPSRLACGSCHDSDAAEAHMQLQTFDPTPTYDATARTGGAWSGDEVESCAACHGEGKDFSAKAVHNVADPYVPPYPR